MRQVQEACHTPIAALRTKASRIVVGHHLIESVALDHELIDHVTAQRRRPVEALRHDLGQDLVLVLTTPIARTRSL